MLVSPQRTTAGRAPFLIVVGAVLVGGLVAVLMLHTLAAQDAFRLSGLQQHLATLTDEEQQQVQVVAADSSPTALQARAVTLGMVPSALTKFHRRPDGRAVGIQTPVYVPPVVHAPAKTKSTTVKTTKTTKTMKTTKSGTSPASPASDRHRSRKKSKSGHSKP